MPYGYASDVCQLHAFGCLAYGVAGACGSQFFLGCPGTQDLSCRALGVRRRPNVFDDEQSVPSYIAAILALIFIVFGGVVLYNLHGVPSPPTFAGAAASMGLLGTYYLFQQCAYRTVGYTFTTADGRRRWLGGFAATQAYAGLGMVIPALLYGISAPMACCAVNYFIVNLFCSAIDVYY